jgi:hypothetical protein
MDFFLSSSHLNGHLVRITIHRQLNVILRTIQLSYFTLYALPMHDYIHENRLIIFIVLLLYVYTLNVGCLHPVASVRSGDEGFLFRLRKLRRRNKTYHQMFIPLFCKYWIHI